MESVLLLVPKQGSTDSCTTIIIFNGLSATLVTKQGSTDSCTSYICCKFMKCDPRFRRKFPQPSEVIAVVVRLDTGTSGSPRELEYCLKVTTSRTSKIVKLLSKIGWVTQSLNEVTIGDRQGNPKLE